MDYKFIEQLLERYFAAETTAEEECLLMAGMAMPDLPAHIAQYRPLFDCLRTEKNVALGEVFDRRVMAAAGLSAPGRITVRARKGTFAHSIRPLWQAAASVAIIALVGIGAGRSFNDMEDAVSPEQLAGTEVSQPVKPGIVDPAQHTASADTLKMER